MDTHWDQISGYLFDTLSPNAREEFERELAANPALRATVDAVQLGLAITERPRETVNVERAEQRLSRKMEERGAIVQKRSTTALRPWRRMLGYTGITASALLLLVIAGRSLATHLPASGVDSPREYVTSAGEHARVTFPDGSSANLAPLTRLRYRQHEGERTVDLSGQAVFSVMHDPAQTFVVRAGSVATTVLGTVFGVQHYPGDRAVQVAVTEGRVQTANSERSLTLSAGMSVRATDSTVVMDNPGRIDAMTAWTRGELVFDAVPVPAMLESVGRWSGYQFRLADSALAQQRVSTVLPIGKPAAMLRALGDLLEVNITAQGDTILLRRRDRTRGRPTPKMAPRKQNTPNIGFTRTEVGK